MRHIRKKMQIEDGHNDKFENRFQTLSILETIREEEDEAEEPTHVV